MEYIEKTLTGIITHGTTSITFTDDFITNDSIIDVYFSSDDIVPTNQEQIGNRLIISIESQTIDISVAVHITNDDTINYANELNNLSDTVENHTSVLISHGSEIINLRHDVSDIENDMQDFDARLDDCFISVSNGKELIADAITDKGVTTSATDTFETMAINIGNIQGGGGGKSVFLLLDKTSEVGYTDSTHVNKYNIDATKQPLFDDYLTYNNSNGTFTPTQKAIDEGVIFLVTLETNSYKTASSSRSEGRIYQQGGQILHQQAPSLAQGSFITNTRAVYNDNGVYSFYTQTPSSYGYPRQFITIKGVK